MQSLFKRTEQVSGIGGYWWTSHLFCGPLGEYLNGIFSILAGRLSPDGALKGRCPELADWALQTARDVVGAVTALDDFEATRAARSIAQSAAMPLA